jgi:hypothetical protein
VRRRQIFLEQKFRAIRQGLQQAKWTHPRGTPTVLHVAHNLALQPHGVRHRRQQHNECQHSLDYRNDNEGSDVQPVIPK